MFISPSLLRRTVGVKPAAGFRACERPSEDHFNAFNSMWSEWVFNHLKTSNNGSLGSGIDEERSEMR